LKQTVADGRFWPLAASAATACQPRL